MHDQPVATRAVLVGWSSGDWRVVSPLLDAGRLPHLAGMVAEGVCGQLASLWPDLPPLLWTSLTTGTRPQRHGILGFEESDGAGGVRPITTRDRTATPLWVIASRAGLVSLAVDAGPTFPADPIAGVVVSNQFVARLSRRGLDTAGSLPPGLVHPPDRAESLVRSWMACSAVPDDLLQRFLPSVGSAPMHPAAIDLVRSAVADTLGVAAVVRELTAVPGWRLAVVRYALVDRLAERFLMFHPPRGPGVLEDAFVAYREVITAAHVLLDELLGELVTAAGPGACVAVASDRGLPWAHLRSPAGRGDRPRAAPFGLLAMAGPGIRRDERISGASILDVCPTLLHTLGLPRGADMDGRVIHEAFDPGHPLGAGTPPEIASWEPASAQAPRMVDAHAAASAAGLERSRRLTLARCRLVAGESAAAEPILRDLAQDDPADTAVAIELAEALRALGRPLEAVDLLRDLAAAVPAGVAADLGSPLAAALVAAGRPLEAAETLRVALAARGPRIDLLVGLAQAEAAGARFAEAAAACRRVLEIDDRHRPALVILASALYRLRRYAEAADAAREAVALGHVDPPTHLLLGTALAACGRAEAAIAALEIACRQDPSLTEARERLAAVHARQRGDFAAAHASRRRGDEAPSGGAVSAAEGSSRIVVVSGLPRSGTSLVMQMLAAGGIPPLTDAVRSADRHNPRGYLEFEAVKRIARDRSWIGQAAGRAVKVIASLVPELPPGYDYRVILVHRDLQEVLASQRAMLGATTATAAADDQLLRAFARHLDRARQWCEAARVPLIDVEHRVCVTDPAGVAARLAEFLGDRLDGAAMAGAVDASLWRNRSQDDGSRA